MTRAELITQLKTRIDAEGADHSAGHSADLNPVIDHLIMVMGDNLHDMAAWLQLPRPEFNHQSALTLIQEHNCEPVQKILRKIMEQDSRIG